MGLQWIFKNPIQRQHNLDSTKKALKVEMKPVGVEKMISDSMENAGFRVAEDEHNQL